MPVKVDGSSMYPTLHDGDLAFMYRHDLNSKQIKRFDIVTIDCKQLDNVIIKRVIGLPGEKIVYKNDCLYVNGKYIKENYLNKSHIKDVKSRYNISYFTDDFEKLTLKELDLSLRKFITGVNGTAITNREPQVNVTPLKNGGTTAIYNHPKTPVSVAIGDLVEYTIRVYNEAEVDGYVEEITDHLPDQLEFIAGNEINTKYGWTVDSNNSKIIKTKYLSKANETTEGDNKIMAFDGTKLDY